MSEQVRVGQVWRQKCDNTDSTIDGTDGEFVTYHRTKVTNYRDAIKSFLCRYTLVSPAPEQAGEVDPDLHEV
jgi:hypothetical protein